MDCFESAINPTEGELNGLDPALADRQDFHDPKPSSVSSQLALGHALFSNRAERVSRGKLGGC